MTGEQTAGEEQGKAHSSARPQSSPPSDLGHYLLGTVSADYGSTEGGWAGAVSPRPGQERERGTGLGAEGRRNTLYLHRMELLSLLLWMLRNNVGAASLRAQQERG